MPKNQKLNYCLIKYLSKQNFLSIEYKKIFRGFIREYPEFYSYQGYQTIYSIVRKLVNCNLITLNRTTQNFEYSSNYTTTELNTYLLNLGISVDFQEEFKNKIKDLNLTMEKTRLEIQFFDQYLKDFPLLKDTISGFKKKSEQQLRSLESEICVLNKLSTHI